MQKQFFKQILDHNIRKSFYWFISPVYLKRGKGVRVSKCEANLCDVFRSFSKGFSHWMVHCLLWSFDLWNTSTPAVITKQPNSSDNIKYWPSVTSLQIRSLLITLSYIMDGVCGHNFRRVLLSVLQFQWQMLLQKRKLTLREDGQRTWKRSSWVQELCWNVIPYVQSLHIDISYNTKIQ